jgi:hypothetical protein
LSESISGQTRTPPHLKWLLNERAMLLGEVQRRESRIQRLTAEAGDLNVRIAALDSAMALFDARVDPQAGGSVRATSERYEGRGGLLRFLMAQLCEASPQGVDTVTLTLRAASLFAVEISSMKDRNVYRDTVGWTLRHLRTTGVIENGYVFRGGHRPSTWRMKSQLSLTSLTAQVEAANESPHA